MIPAATTTAMIRPATRGPDPVRDRGGIDIGFLECCRRAGGTTGQQGGLAVRGRAPPLRGRRTAASYPRKRVLGVRMGALARAGWSASPCRTAPGSWPPESGDNAAMPRVRSVARPALLAAPLAVVLGMILPRVVLAHGGTVPPPPEPGSFLLDWSFDPLVWLPAIAALLVWRYAIRKVAREHPGHPVAVRRTVSWTLGVAALVVALDSGIERYDTTLFSVHMVQHLIL